LTEGVIIGFGVAFFQRQPTHRPDTGPGAVDTVALGPFKKQSHGHGRENEISLLYILVVTSLVGTISRKSLKLLPPDVIF